MHMELGACGGMLPGYTTYYPYCCCQLFALGSCHPTSILSSLKTLAPGLNSIIIFHDFSM